MAISPLKILIIFEIWSLGSGFFTYKQKGKKKFYENPTMTLLKYN